ncbi:putative transcription factor MYB-HB-like family [Helianthus annuus]|nr:putative transcription factor MYB-HB-like family [Helianthus annuus]
MESQVTFTHEASSQPDDVFVKDVITSETNCVTSNLPVKKQTRQWAAWTRQEEESFFTALRQVGKASFTMILYVGLQTNRMNTNKTLFMNKSCSSVKKYMCPRTVHEYLPNNFEKITSRVQSKNKDQVRHYYYRLVRRMNKLLGPELSLDAKNSKDTNAAMLRWWSLLEKHSCKASKLHLKPRRFKIFLETLVNAYKKWEKAAIAGVSLVADAAEHLERTSLDQLANTVKSVNGDKGSDPIAPNFNQNMKLKLQLFPVDESTRRSLERDNHNPHLELTLSTRKKISSVLEHMNRKWGSSSIASGELTLVPYYVQTLNILNCQKWTHDSVVSAGDVYAAIGSPSVFRLRYFILYIYYREREREAG